MFRRLEGSKSTLSLLTAILLATQTALAKPPAKPAPASALPSSGNLGDALTGSAKSDYAAAKILYEDGDYQGALLKLKSAYETSKDPRLLWNMAACEKNQRHYAEVSRLVNRYLTEGGTLVSNQERTEANELLETVRGFVVDLTVEVDQADATILYDEQPIAKSPMSAPVQVDMGQHTIRVTKPGFVEFTSTSALEGGKPFHVTATLAPERHEGRLRVLAGPSDVIQVDHKTSKVGLWEGALSSGTHSVYVSAKGKRPHQTDVIVQDNDLTNLHVTLEDEAKPAVIEKNSVPTWVWIAGGAAVAVGGGIGAYFLFKPENTTKYQTATQGSWGSVDF
jgi:hypothetical protein